MEFGTPTLPTVEIEDVEGIVGGGLFGALQGGAIMQLLHLKLVSDLGALIGRPTYANGWLLMFVLGVVLAVPFLVFVAGSINTFVNKVIMLSSRSEILQKVLVPLLNISALGVTAYTLGQIYGLGIGLLHVVLVPVILTYVLGYSVPMLYGLAFPAVAVVLSWVVYGSMMGLVYGLTKEA
ncbi:MAG: hypothetical protein ABEJ31_02695 [Haloarculaceae archaeon]